jgi:multicomponent Na+:H+ antiporter subunit D
MVELGVLGVARVVSTAFAQPLEPSSADLRMVLVGVAVLTAVVAAVNCFQQRHLKRLLAFSTISHMGIVLCGVALLGDRALAGAAVYALGHGLTKGSLFLGTGTLLHRFAEIDEFKLRGRGRELPLLGVVFALGALVLASAPLATTFFGKSLIEDASLAEGYDWLPALLVACSALTGAAVLRASARIFLGWGSDRPRAGGTESEEESQAEAAHEEGRGVRPHPRTPALLVLLPALLMLGALLTGLVPDLVPSVERAAGHFRDDHAYIAAVLTGHDAGYLPVTTTHVKASAWIYSVAALAATVAGAAVGLRGHQLVPLRAGDVLRAAHSGHIGDYIAWWTFGASVLGGLLLWALAG